MANKLVLVNHIKRLCDWCLLPTPAIDAHSRLSQGLASVTKRDFFKDFYSAFDSAFTEANIRSGWLKAGIEPFDPDQVLKVFDEKG